MKTVLLLIGFLLLGSYTYAADSTAAQKQTSKRSKAHTDYRVYEAKDWEKQQKEREALKEEKHKAKEAVKQEKKGE
ncbi:MAG: hypothetical protein R3302_04720 [Sulfurimonadaceae bacterium]|nr:hypothetical protein [Sulfurimonadaceae bacterium]